MLPRHHCRHHQGHRLALTAGVGVAASSRRSASIRDRAITLSSRPQARPRERSGRRQDAGHASDSPSTLQSPTATSRGPVGTMLIRRPRRRPLRTRAGVPGRRRHSWGSRARPEPTRFGGTRVARRPGAAPRRSRCPSRARGSRQRPLRFCQRSKRAAAERALPSALGHGANASARVARPGQARARSSRARGRRRQAQSKSVGRHLAVAALGRTHLSGPGPRARRRPHFVSRSTLLGLVGSRGPDMAGTVSPPTHRRLADLPGH
jgi:hypothetical protein